MNYTLAKQLKDNGFEQTGLSGQFPSNDNKPENQVYAPILEELINACGDKFAELGKGNSQIDYKWTAQGLPIEIGNCGHGKSPTEAVAKLWLVINKK